MIESWRSTLLVAAAAYLVLLPSAALTFWRSAAFAIAGVAMVGLLVARRRSGKGALVPPCDRVIAVVLLGWSAWTLASVAWSVDPAYSASEWKSDVLWGLVTIAIFYVASADVAQGFERLAGTALGALAFWTSLAVGLAFSWLGWDARPFHRGDGAFATYLVTVAPLAFLLLWPPPAGLRTSTGTAWGAGLLLALLVATARLSDNRIMWIALALGIAIAILCAPGSRRWLRAAAAIALVATFAILFADAAQERAEHVYGHGTSVAETIAADPRIAIWKRAAGIIREHPWAGYGYGIHIAGGGIGAQVGDAGIRHPHNLFVGQWLQSGAIGATLFVALFAVTGWRFARLARSRDAVLARLGAVGLAVIVGYAVRNLTDDFFLRANGRLLFATTAMLLGAAALRERTGSESK